MKSTILTTSAAAMLVLGAASTQACAAGQWDHRSQYPYEQREEIREYRAFTNGERDGYSKGLDDIRHHRVADLHRQRWYRNGDHDYDHYYGTKDEYRIEYRRGFERGYDRAFREVYYREGWRR